MIYTDGIHLITDGDIEELHTFAKKIGLKRDWFQANKRHPHYDIFRSMVSAAISNGAVVVSRRKIVNMLKRNKK